MKVDFVICGTQKGGTTVLDSYLREHPEICMADQKEVHFFDNEDIYKESEPNYSIYHSFFSKQSSHKIIGEATPIYMYWYDAPKRIWKYNQNMKLIVLLRNPIDRAYSHWNMERTRGAEELSFSEAIQQEENRFRDNLPYQHRVYSYIDRGFYVEQLRRLWFYFSKENVLVIKNEDLKNEPNNVLNDVCDFLEVNHFNNIESKNVHSLAYESKLSIEDSEYLKSIYQNEIQELEKILNWDCHDWLI